MEVDRILSWLIHGVVGIGRFVTRNRVLVLALDMCPSVQLGYFLKHFHDFGPNEVSNLSIPMLVSIVYFNRFTLMSQELGNV